MIARALARLGLTGIVVGTLLGFGFMVADVPYVSSYTDWVWGLEWAGLILFVVGLVLTSLI